MGKPKVSLKQNIGMDFKDNVEKAFTHESVREWGGASRVNMVGESLCLLFSLKLCIHSLDCQYSTG